MRLALKLTITFLLILLLTNCKTNMCIMDSQSRDRQMDMREHRTGLNFKHIGNQFIAIFASLILADYISIEHPRVFKKFRLINESTDTIYVNMLTDYVWHDNSYCDIMDIKLNPKQKSKVLVPMNAKYNVYFRNSLYSDDDELLEINTSKLSKLGFKPGMTEDPRVIKELILK